MPEYSSIAQVLSLLRILADPTHDRDIVNLAVRFETSVKTVRRDIQEFRSNGVVVSEDSGPFNRKTFSIDREELPTLRLTYVSREGSNSQQNVQLLCRRCNLPKSDKI